MQLLLEVLAVIFCITLPISPVLLEEVPEILWVNKIIPAKPATRTKQRGQLPDDLQTD